MNKSNGIESVFAKMATSRNTAIQHIMTTLKCDRTDAMLRYDTSVAPLTTDREKFRYIGFDFPKDFVPKTDEAADLFNKEVIKAYSLWGDAIIRYEHLSPKVLTSRLQLILEEKTRLIPPTKDCTQYIDLGTGV